MVCSHPNMAERASRHPLNAILISPGPLPSPRWRKSPLTSPIDHDHASGRDEKQDHLKEIHGYGERINQTESEIVRKVHKNCRKNASAIVIVCPGMQDRQWHDAD
jgi:hypothetical protein